MMMMKPPIIAERCIMIMSNSPSASIYTRICVVEKNGMTSGTTTAATTIIADLLVPFCDAASLNLKDASRAVKKRFLVSISFVDHDALHQCLFKDQYLDWNGVQEYLAEISYSVSDWIPLLKLLDFIQEVQPSSEVVELISNTLAGVRVTASQTKNLSPIESLRLCFAKIKKKPSWDLLCKTFLACNLVDIDQVQVLQALFLTDQSNNEDEMQQAQIADLVRFMASYKHSKKEYCDSFVSILDDSKCQVRSHVVIQSLKTREAMREARQNDAILSGAAFRKPSLTQLLETKMLREGARDPQNSFASFCRSSNLASNVNLRIKQTIYFLLCLPDHDPTVASSRMSELSRLLGGDRILLTNIQGISILSPDVQELRKLIQETHYTITPSETLRRFKNECIAQCMTLTTGKVYWTTVMRLYMAAYCRPDISKDLWCFVMANSNLTPGNCGTTSYRQHTSSETENTVQSFVKTYPMALREVMDVMLMDL